MDTAIIRHKNSIAEYVQVFGVTLLPVFAIPLLCIFPFGVLHLAPAVVLALAGFGGALSAVQYIRDLQRVASERFISLSKDGITYQAFSDDVRSMRWDDITRVQYVTRLSTPASRRVGLSSGGYLTFVSAGLSFAVCRCHLFSLGDGKMSFFSRGYFVNHHGCNLLLAVLKLKLGDRLECDSTVESGKNDPASLRQTAQLLRSWGNFAEAEQAMKVGLYYAPVFDKANIAAYLDEYAGILRHLGRTTEAVEIESRSLERLKTLTHLKENILPLLGR